MSRPPTLTLPPCARAHRLDTERGAFAVHDARPDGAPIGTALLVPGFTGSKEDFIALLAPLAAAGFRAVAVDGRGQHETPGPRNEQAYEQRELALDVQAQARALHAPGDGPLHLLGHSLGGLVTRAAVLRDPAPFRSLTALSSGPAAIEPVQRTRVRMLIDALGTMGMEQVWAAMQALNPPEAAHEALAPELTAFLRQRWLNTVPEQLIATGRQMLAEPDRVAELARTGLPVHVVSGTVDYAWPVPQMDAMARRLSARRTVVEGAEHSPNAERPEKTAGALAGFWSDVG
ncbi:alpha/beta fold hydrolase [Streptomyces noursei]|uniref:Alpha/beta hydrolase n=1 Tax=Streptomyces noursei TaxID=1971 RepID=A0A059WDB4_STRNR|nr:alpha/beta hydrolase [Streptomyces noursei]AKA05882.1 hydrolase [Streptomyces noursei ZPM]AIA05771.1 putative hydrolase [Streptomyces noursei]EOT02172.1 hydrolase [Streptomyces noursei CCRC 11814]EXU85495.1 hydrolase [Streptomyces noursei PD-1]UWS74286.1 alpha/beta hydrolase [Streptomyces noursei]